MITEEQFAQFFYNRGEHDGWGKGLLTGMGIILGSMIVSALGMWGYLALVLKVV